MKKYLLTTTAAGAALAIAAPAHAGGYLSIFGGASFNDLDQDARIFQSSSSFTTTEYGSFGNTVTAYTTIPYSYSSVYGFTSTFVYFYDYLYASWISATDINIETSTGFVIGAAFGHDYGTGVRTELEIAYRKHDIDVAGTWYYAYGNYGYSYRTAYEYGYRIVTYTTVGATRSLSYQFSTFSSPLTSGYTTSVSFYTTKSSTFAESGDMTAMSIMANVWFDGNFNIGSATPYVGVGIGYADVELDVGSIDVSDSGIAFQLAAGLAFDISDNSVLSLEYRRFEVPSLDLTYDGYSLGIDYETNEIIVAWRTKF